MAEKGVRRGLAALAGHFFSRSGFKDAWHEPVLFLGAVAALLPEAVPAKYVWIPVLAAIVLLGVGTIRAYVVKVKSIHAAEERDSLRRQLNSLEELDNERRAFFKGAVKATLRDLASEIDVDNAHSRVSVYVHSPGRFSSFVRISDNPIHEKVGRGFYPEDEGVIALAWQTGSEVCTDLPGSQPTYSRKLLDKYRIPIGVSKTFNMMSRSLVGVRITDLVDGSRGHVGVVVIESTRPRGVNASLLSKVTASRTWHVLQMQLSGSRDFLPDVTEAEERGF